MRKPVKFFAEMNKENGRVNRQGVIYDFKTGEGQFLDWITGEPSDKFCFTDDYLEKIELFDTDYDLRMFIEDCNK